MSIEEQQESVQNLFSAQQIAEHVARILMSGMQPYPEFGLGGVPMEVAAKVYGKDALWVRISIHSTTRVETAILHNNHYYSSTHFHKQIISHPLKSRPTIPAHSQIRSHCANFPVRISP